MNTTRFLIAAIASLLGLFLGGCKTMYVEPTTGPTAKVRVKVEHSDYAVTYGAWSEGLCKRPGSSIGIVGSSAFVRNDFANTYYKPIGMLGSSSEPSTFIIEKSVPAGTPFFLVAQAILSTSISGGIISATTCHQTIEFLPAAGSEYEATHQVKGSQCIVFLNKLVQVGGTVMRMPLTEVKQHRCD
jgi:hypothetical protein